MKENPFAKPQVVYKDVVVVGNGPSGLAMSYALSGRRAVFTGGSHPDRMLDAALRTTLAPNEELTVAGLASLARCCEARSGCTPLGGLLDQLVRPGADGGAARPSLVAWPPTRARRLSHVVIGKGPPGGTWQSKMDGKTITLSLSHWMELPGLAIHESDAGRRGGAAPDGSRLSTSTVADYYKEYVCRLGLEKYQRRGVVTAVAEYDDADGDESDKKIKWIVEGRDAVGRPFRYLSKFIVLACGTTDDPNRLNVPGEQLPWVRHNTRELDDFLSTADVVDAPVLVIGSGLSSCDGVLCARTHSANVFHVYRGGNGLARWLPLTTYPEYLEMHELMVGVRRSSGYRGTADFQLDRLSADPSGRRTATLESTTGAGRVEMTVSAVAVLVGSTADLSFLPRDDLAVGKGAVDSRSNPLDVNLSTYELNRLPKCYAIGPLAGDLFVRHNLGGIVAAAAHMQKTV